MLRFTDMAAGTGLSGPVGLAPGQDWTALAALRDAWRDALKGAGAKRAALHFGNTFDFAAALLGCWAAGCTAVIAGDATEITTALLAGRADVLLGDFPAGGPGRPGMRTTWNEPPFAAPAPATHATPLPPAVPDLPVIIFTSGSTGLPLAVEKTWSDLGNEVETLEAVLGAGLSGARVLSTVGHQHIYGLLFRCLWPLAAGRPFSDRLIRFPEELAESLQAPGPVVLVASPAFLRRLPEARLPEPHLPDASGATVGFRPLTAVFSSGGPLPWACVPACAHLLGADPVEIYGSSETGGIAWRRRAGEDPPWTAFPKVEIAIGEAGELLLVKSPHMKASKPFATSDRVSAVEGGFRLLGRADRIVKVEEKRLSLTAMEDLLTAHPRVAEARVLVLAGDRDTLGAVLRLRDSAIPTRGSEARAALVQSLRAHLLNGFDRVLLPKRWRLVETMPANAAGKTALAALRSLFDPQVNPVILETRRLENGAAVLELEIPAELEHFRGHFPQLPLLPGVVQLDWAILEGARLFGPFGAFRGLQALKFQRPIFPGMRISLELARLKDKSGISFKYDSSQGRHASGQAIFTA
ncbi:MAG: hypothetical protein JWO30_3268 [Fibrobacteres bacterium]|nr:hypothetical protein [Fibrobacterota bacterium]